MRVKDIENWGKPTTYLPTVGMRVLGKAVGIGEGRLEGRAVLGRAVGVRVVGLCVGTAVGLVGDRVGATGAREQGHFLGTCKPLLVSWYPQKRIQTVGLCELGAAVRTGRLVGENTVPEGEAVVPGEVLGRRVGPRVGLLAHWTPLVEVAGMITVQPAKHALTPTGAMHIPGLD